MALTLTRLSTASLTACTGRAKSGIAFPSSASSWRITSFDTYNKIKVISINHCVKQSTFSIAFSSVASSLMMASQAPTTMHQRNVNQSINQSLLSKADHIFIPGIFTEDQWLFWHVQQWIKGMTINQSKSNDSQSLSYSSKQIQQRWINSKFSADLEHQCQSCNTKPLTYKKFVSIFYTLQLLGNLNMSRLICNT